MSPLRALSIRTRLIALFLVASATGALLLVPLVEPGRRPEAWLWAAGACAVGFVAASMAARSILGPLLELKEKLDRLAAGEWNQVLKDRAGDELSAVYDAVNRYVLMRDNEGLARSASPGSPPGRSQAATHPADPAGTATAPGAGGAEAPDPDVLGLRLLLAQASALQTAYDFPEAAGRLLAACNAHLKLEWSSLCLLDSSRQHLRLIASAGLSDSLSHELALAGPRPVSFAAREGICGEALDAAAPVVVNKGERDPRFKQTPATQAQGRKIRSLACVPMSLEGQVAGIGNFCNIESPAGFGPRELAFLQEAMSLLAQVNRKTLGPDEAFREAVSGLHDYEYWKGQLGLELRRYRRRPTRLSLVKLKCAFGRSGIAAEEMNGALASVGAILRETMRSQDGATRRKDSFYVFLPETDTLGALFFAGRVKDKVDALGVSLENPELRFVAAMGVASCPENVSEPEALMEACDEAVRESIRIGDHRLVCFQGNASPAAAAPREAN